jgi:hypothetical protein
MSAGRLALKKHPTEGQQCEDLQRLKISKTFFVAVETFSPSSDGLFSPHSFLLNQSDP